MDKNWELYALYALKSKYRSIFLIKSKNQIKMDINTNTYGGKSDGSPLGNDHVNALIHGSVATCVDHKCPFRGWHFKCYDKEGFNQCKTYNQRKNIASSKLNSDSVGLVKHVTD